MDFYLYLTGGAFCSLIAFIIFGVCKIVRRRYPVAVSCWFCGEKLKIPWDQINSWDCPSCVQYNGFGEDGGYNKTIPAQFCEELNVQPVSMSKVAANGDVSGPANILCANCSQNQCLKVKQLANFVPSAEENFDVEVDAYSLHLEQVYRLCRVCETSVRKELARQDETIRATLAEHSACSPWSSSRDDSDLNVFQENNSQFGQRRPTAFIFHMFSIVCAFLLMSTGYCVASSHFNLHVPLPLCVKFVLEFLSDRAVPLLIIGTFTKIAAVFISGLIRLRALDACCCFCWLAMMLLFFVLEDSHVYSRILISLRLCLSILNLILTTMSGQKPVGSRTKKLEQSPRISPNIQLVANDLNGFSKFENTNSSDEDSLYHENSREFVDVPCVKLRQLRLGTPVPKKKKKDPLKVFGNSALSNVTENTLAFDHHKNGVSRRYPLLSPPKFCPSGGLTNSSSLSRGFQLQKSLPLNGLQSESSLRHFKNADTDTQFDNRSLFDRKPHPPAASVAESDDLSSAATSQQQSLDGSSFVLKMILAVSLVVNIVAILYVLLKFRTNVSVDTVKTYIRNLLRS